MIVLTGTPGTGKTALSARLEANLRLTVVHLNDLVVGEGLFSGYDAARESRVVDLARTRKRIGELAASRSDELLVEGHLSHLVAAPSLVRLAVVLRCNPRVLSERLRSQGYGLGKVRENALAELLDVCLVEAVEAYGAERVAEIDTTGRKVENVAEEAGRVLAGGCRQVYGVDWIGELEAEGSLDEYLG